MSEKIYISWNYNDCFIWNKNLEQNESSKIVKDSQLLKPVFSKIIKSSRIERAKNDHFMIILWRSLDFCF